MNPSDDPSWPMCADGCEEPSWCDHVVAHLRSGNDGKRVQPGTRVCVPIAPMYGVFAEASISPDAVGPGMHSIFVIKAAPFTNAEEEFYLGLWSAGEGRLVIADIIHDWLRGQITDDTCKNSRHTPERSQQQRAVRTDPWIMANLWSLKMNAMCFPCWLHFQSNAPQNNNNFGLGGVESGKGPGTGTGTSGVQFSMNTTTTASNQAWTSAQRAQNALNQRFGI